MMNVRVLERPPASGTIEEVRFNATGDCVWLRFDPHDDKEWVGIFGCGHFNRTVAVATLDAPSLTYVVAAGNDYLLDHRSRDLQCLFKGSRAQGVIAVAALSCFVIWDSNKLQAVAADRTHRWLSSRISWDGFRRIHFDDGLLKGEAWSPIEQRWLGFELNPENGHFRGGSYVAGAWDQHE